jgi:hypothetical protein
MVCQANVEVIKRQEIVKKPPLPVPSGTDRQLEIQTSLARKARNLEITHL